jgi:hypothetical protein
MVVVNHEVPAIIRKELRSVMAVKILSIIFKNSKTTTRNIHKFMYELYHGTTNNICPQPDMLLAGNGVYEPMFEKRITVVINATASNPPVTLVLNKNCLQINNDYVVRQHITKSMLESKTAKQSSGLISGRNLHSVAMRAMANMKKALAILSSMPEVEALTPVGVEYKSGISEGKGKQKLLQLMFVELRGKEDAGDEDDVEVTVVAQPVAVQEIPVTDVVTCPNGWYFNEWFAFCMFGPFVSESDRVTLIEAGGTAADSNVKNGRAEQRKKKKKEEDVERNHDSVNKRGVSMQMKLGMAELEMKSEDLLAQKKERRMMALNCSIQVVQQNLDQAENRAHKFCPEYDENNHFWKKVSDLENESENLQGMLKDMANESSPAPKRSRLFGDSPQKASNVPVQVITCNGSISSPSQLH